MFIDANDEKWSIQKIQNISHEQPLSVCFMDEYGNSFLRRVKECMGESILLSLAIPFECYVERNGDEHDKRKGFLMVNNFMGMMYGYGLMEKLKDDYMPLISKKDIYLLRKKGILCFLDYGSVYIEFTRNIWLDKRWMGKATGNSFLREYGKNPKRFLYDFQNRRPNGNAELKPNINEVLTEIKGHYHTKCIEVLNDLIKQDIPFTVQETDRKKKMSFGCKLLIRNKDCKRAYEVIKKHTFVKKSLYHEKGNEVWVLEKVPILVTDDSIHIEKWQCDWYHVPYIEMIKTP